MARKNISEADLAERLRSHKAWSDSYEQNPEAPVGRRLVLNDSVLSDVSLVARDITSAQLFGCEMTNLVFQECDLSFADFLNSVFRTCSFINCRFVKADFRGCDCRGVNFLRCDLTRADFTDTNLSSANLTDSVLDWAWLVNTDLRYATLEGVRLKGTRLGGTKLYNDRRFTLASTEGAVVNSVDLSPRADGTRILGPEALELLRK